MENEDEALDEVLDEDLDIFELAMAYRDDGRSVRITDVPVKIIRNEVLDAQRYATCAKRYSHVKTVSGTRRFFKDDYGILRRLHPTIHGLEHIVLPETL